MSQDVYERLREQLDQYSVGFPETASGVEMKILKRLFTAEEARMYLELSMLLETPEAAAQRIGQDPDRVSQLLARMADKGLVFRLRKGDGLRYAAAPYVVGIYEYQLPTLDRELAAWMDQYLEEAYAGQVSQQTVPMRTVPVGRSLNPAWPVAPYEDLRAIVDSKDRIAVARCICRVQQGLLEQACDSPLEVCFMFGSHAEYYVERGMGRWIERPEALRILDQCEEAGLVPQPFNAQNPGGLCNCCGDCCGMLRALKKHPRPAEMVVSNYRAVVDPDLCSACGTCAERCQMEAIRVGEGDFALVDNLRCIGCGLCVTTCPSEAVSLTLKPDAERRQPPASAQETMMQLAEQRGKTLIPLSVLRKAEAGA